MENLYLRIAEFGYKNPQGFTIQQLKEGISSGESEDIIIEKHFRDAYDLWQSSNTSTRETPFFLFDNFHGGYLNCTYGIKADILFSYIDYLEFQEARKMSQQAINSSIEATNLAQDSIFYAKWALILSIIFSIGGIVVQIWSAYQSTVIDMGQFGEIKSMISSEVKK